MPPNSPPPQWQKGDLWDTDPNTFVAREAIKRLDLTQCYLTDDAIMKLLINKRERTITGVNIFRFNEIEFVKNGFLRSKHKGRGVPALAPDGTVMTVKAGALHGSTIVLNGGNSNLSAGSWSIENYQAKSDHPRYEEWLSKIKWTNAEALRAGIPPTSINATLTIPPNRVQQNISKPKENKNDSREKKTDSPVPKAEDLTDEVQPNNAENSMNEGQERITSARSATPQEAPVEETPSEYATLSSTYSEITTSKPATPEPSRPEADHSQVVNSERAASEPSTSKAATPEPVFAEPGASEPDILQSVITQPDTPDRAVSEPAGPEPASAEPVTSEQVLVQPVTPDRSVSEPPTTSDIAASEPIAFEHSKAADSEAVGLGVAGSEVVGSEAVGLVVARSEATGSGITGPEVVIAATSELETSKPTVSKPTASEVNASHPVARKPVSSELPASEFTVSEPASHPVSPIGVFSGPPTSDFTVSGPASLETSASEPAPTEPTSKSEAPNPVASEAAVVEPVASGPSASGPAPEPASQPAPLKSFASISMQANINSPKQLPPTSTPRNINTFLFQPEAQGPMNSNMMQSQPPASVRQQPPPPGPTFIGARPESTVGLGINTGLMQQTALKTPASMFRYQYTPRQPSLEIPESPPPPARPTSRSGAQMAPGSNAAMPTARHNLHPSTTTQPGSITKVTISLCQSPPPTPASTGSLKRKATESLDRMVTFFVSDNKSVYSGSFNFSERKWAENAPGFYERFKGTGRRVKNMNGLVYDIVENPKLFEAMLYWIDTRKVMQRPYFTPYDLESYYLELYLAAVNYVLPGLSNAIIDELHDWHSHCGVRFQMIDKVYKMTQPGAGLRRFYFSCMMALSTEEFEATSIEQAAVMVDIFAVKKATWGGMKAKEAFHEA